MTFVGQFTSTGTPTSTNLLPAEEVRTVVASSMVIGTALPASALVGGVGYTYTGLQSLAARTRKRLRMRARSLITMRAAG